MCALVIVEMAATQLTASPVTVSARSLASLEGLRASSVKFSSFGTLRPGTLRQSQFRPFVVKAAAVVAPKVLLLSSLFRFIAVWLVGLD